MFTLKPKTGRMALKCCPQVARPVRSRPARCPAQQAPSRRTVTTFAAQPTQQRGVLKAHGALFSTQAVFALWYVVGHAVLSDNDPLTFALAREMLSAATLLTLAQTVEGDLEIKDNEDLFHIGVLGVLCYGSVIGFMFALADLPEVQVAIAQPLVPALALGMGALFGGEALSVVSAIGILVSISGAIAFTVFNADGGGAAGGGHAWGYAGLLFELLSYAGQMVYLPRLSGKYQPISLTALYYSVASVATAATLALRERDDLSNLFVNAAPLASPSTAGALIFAVAGPTVFAFCAMSFSSSKVKPSTNASYITLQPILVALLSLVLYGTTLDSAECGAGAFVVAGLALTVIGSPQMDRKWAEYVSDLPTNVPQTIATVADASIEAAVAVKDVSLEAAATVADASIEAAVAVKDVSLEAAAGVKETLVAVATNDAPSQDERRK